MVRWQVTAAAAMLLGLSAAAWPALSAWSAERTGAALYDGRLPLAARIAGHEDMLPPLAARCANCHEGGVGATYAPALTAASLREARPRRGGPPSTFDGDGFCRLLRTGIDPAWVQIPRAMPRYEITDEDCRALWAHVSTR